MPHLSVAVESYPIAGSFVISRGAKSEATVIVATLQSGRHRGRGECVPYSRYGESIESVLRQIEALRPALEAGATRAELQKLMPGGAARNALDCALWDLEAKRRAIAAYELAKLPPPAPALTAYTISLAPPAASPPHSARTSPISAPSARGAWATM